MAVTPASPTVSRDSGSLNAAISRAMVRIHAEDTAGGPVDACTTIDRDLIVVVLQNSHTSGEHQDAIGRTCITAVEDLTGRSVTAFMSADHHVPDIVTEIFVLEPE
jgi:uncharacterized protein YbcI